MHRWLLSFLMLMPVPAVADDLLIGLGYLNGLAGLNLEWATEHNSFYAMPSVYLDSGGLDTDEPRWVAGWRHKMERGLMSENGFYTGLMAGDLGGESHYERLGVGVELGHEEERDNNDLDVEPVVVLGISFSLRR